MIITEALNLGETIIGQPCSRYVSQGKGNLHFLGIIGCSIVTLDKSKTRQPTRAFVRELEKGVVGMLSWLLNGRQDISPINK